MQIWFFSSIMATIWAHGLFVPFTLPLDDVGHVGVLEDFLSLRFNLWIRSMHMKQETYNVDNDILETTLMQNNKNEDGHI